MTRRNQWLLIAAAALSAWFVLVLTLWAIRPLTDSVPVGANAKGQPTSQEVKCSSLFEGNAHDQAPPVLAKPQKYTRESCVAMHREARIMFGIDAVLYVLGMSVVGALFVHGRRAQRAPVPALG